MNSVALESLMHLGKAKLILIIPFHLLVEGDLWGVSIARTHVTQKKDNRNTVKLSAACVSKSANSCQSLNMFVLSFYLKAKKSETRCFQIYTSGRRNQS